MGRLLAVLVTGYLFTYHRDALIGVGWRVCGLAGRWWELPAGCALGDARVYNATSLKLVIPTVGHTGTTSVLQAARELGYRSYGFEEVKLFAAPSLKDGLVDHASWATPISRCRVEALSLEPTVDLLPLVVEASPDAKFILTWRDYASWWRGTQKSLSRGSRLMTVTNSLAVSASLVPWLRLLGTMTGYVSRLYAAGDPFVGEGDGSVLAYVHHYVLSGWYPETNMFWRGAPILAGHEEAYLAHQDEIRRLVPRARLLEFDVARHGWAELTGFLGAGAPAPPAGRPFPRTRQGGYRFADEPLSQNPGTAAAALAALSLAGSAGFTAAVLAVRAAAGALAA